MKEEEIKKFYKNTFNTVADGYDSNALRFFPESAARLPGYLRLQGHEHVLDVATGTGVAALSLGSCLPEGKVTGIDFSEKMLASAQKKISAKGLENVNLMEMDMQQINFPDDHFDGATCCFGIFFIENMVEQLRHIASKVKEGGRVVVTSFFENSFSPQVDLFFSSLERYGINPPTMTWKRVATEEKCRTLFNEAGVDNVSIDKVDLGYKLSSPDEWWQIVWNGGFRGVVEQLEDKDLIRFKEDHLKEIADLANGGGANMELGIIYSVGNV